MTENLPDPMPVIGFHLLNADGELATILPMPSELAAMITAHVERDVAALRRGVEHRGGVLAPSDMFEIHRHLQRAADLVADYLRKFKDVGKHIKDMQEEALADTVGADAQGQPTGSLTVPDHEGDIKITRKSRNTHTISPEQILPAFASMFADQHADAVMKRFRTHDGEHPCCADQPLAEPEHRAAVGVAIAEAILDALNNVGELGKFDPQVSKVRAYADHLARNGQDAAAGIVLAAINTKREYDGISVERKQ